MKRNLGNFTRGSQLLGHFGFMFAAGLRGPAIVAFVALAWILWSTLSARLADHDQYLIWMRLYALAYRFMEFDPAKRVALEMAGGGHLQLPIGMLIDFPPVVLAWAKFLSALRSAAITTLVILVPLFVLFYWFAERFGGHSKERKHERGAMLVTYDALARELEDHNARERGRELRELFGWRGRFVRTHDLEAAGFYTPAKLADLPYPWRLEASHAMLIGTTGTGKTVALRDLIAAARARRQRVCSTNWARCTACLHSKRGFRPRAISAARSSPASMPMPSTAISKPRASRAKPSWRSAPGGPRCSRQWRRCATGRPKRMMPPR